MKLRDRILFTLGMSILKYRNVIRFMFFGAVLCMVLYLLFHTS